MGTKAVEAAVEQARTVLQQENTPARQHQLALVEARLEGLVVQVSTPQRGTPFQFELVGEDGGKPVREPLGAGWVTATKVQLPAHDGLVTVLPRHAPMVGLLGGGELILTTRKAAVPSPRFPDRTIEVAGDVEFRMFVSGGTYRVKDNLVLVLAERGFVPNRLILEDLEAEDDRRAVQAKAADGALEADGLHNEVLVLKKKEIAARLAAAEANPPSITKEAELAKLRAMEKALG